MSEFLPAAYAHGKVVGRFIKAVGDSGDAGVLPEAVPAAGSVTFIPDELERVVTDATAAPSTFFVHEPITAQLDSAGYLSRSGNRGVWLWAGDWTVAISVTGVSRLPFKITVSAAHTNESPLDLWLVAP